MLTTAEQVLGNTVGDMPELGERSKRPENKARLPKREPVKRGDTDEKLKGPSRLRLSGRSGGKRTSGFSWPARVQIITSPCGIYLGISVGRCTASALAATLRFS